MLNLGLVNNTHGDNEKCFCDGYEGYLFCQTI